MNRSQAQAEAETRYGGMARAWILAGVRYVSKNMGLDRDGWNHFDGQGRTWGEAFADVDAEKGKGE